LVITNILFLRTLGMRFRTSPQEHFASAIIL
jgi:hypothetical protein